MTDSGQQALRFGIPGAVLMGSALLSYICVRWLSGEDLSTVAGPWTNGIDSVVAIVGCIPLGWLVFQVYFLLYRPWLLHGRLIRRDRGLEVLALLSDEQQQTLRRIFTDLPESFTPVYRSAPDDTNRGWFPVLRLPSEAGTKSRWWHRAPRERRIEYARAWRRNWEIVHTLLIFAEAHGGATLVAEHRRLSDAYHGTGCARYALYGGTGAGTAVALLQLARRDDLSMAPALGAASILLATALLGAYALHHVRRQAWKRSVAVAGRGLRLHLADKPATLLDIATHLERSGAAVVDEHPRAPEER